MKDAEENFFSKPSRLQNIEFGLMLVVISCLFALWTDQKEFMFGAISLGFVALIVPVVYSPLTSSWFGLAKLLSKISSTVLLSIVFFTIVTPVGLIRRWIGKDPLQLKAFKKDQSSVLINRNQVYSSDDLIDLF